MGYRRGVDKGGKPWKVRPREVAAVAVEAQMELFATLDAENAIDNGLIRVRAAEIRALQRRIDARNRRKQELREANKRLEGLRVA